MARKMSAVERAARDAMNPYVREGLISRSTVNAVARDGLPVAEKEVRDNYTPDQTFYYAQKIVEAKERYNAATAPAARALLGTRLMLRETLAAVYAVVRAEKGDTGLATRQAVETMETVRDTAREMRSEFDEIRGIADASGLEAQDPAEATR